MFGKYDYMNAARLSTRMPPLSMGASPAMGMSVPQKTSDGVMNPGGQLLHGGDMPPVEDFKKTAPTRQPMPVRQNLARPVPVRQQQPIKYGMGGLNRDYFSRVSSLQGRFNGLY